MYKFVQYTWVIHYNDIYIGDWMYKRDIDINIFPVLRYKSVIWFTFGFNCTLWLFFSFCLLLFYDCL